MRHALGRRHGRRRTLMPEDRDPLRSAYEGAFADDQEYRAAYDAYMAARDACRVAWLAATRSRAMSR